MLSTPRGRRRAHQQFTLPDGKTVIATLPEDLDILREKHGQGGDTQAEVVIHGSTEHANYLRQSQHHHESRRAQLREKHGHAFDEWEDVQSQLNSVTAELDRLTRRSTGLHGNFSKFGYDAGVRTYSDDSGSASPSEGHGGLGSRSHSEDAHESRQGETIKLIKKPVVKQWFHRGLLWRASEQTEIMAIELFFDLLYVGIIHINGEHMSELAVGEELQRFVITFMMTWKIWSEITQALSWYESDDVFTRVTILFHIACMLGFTTNMINSFNSDPEHNTFTQLIAFYLATRFASAVHYAVTGVVLPMIRSVMITYVVLVLVPAALWIASIHVEMPSRLGLVWTALILDLYGNGIYLAFFQYARKVGPQTRLGKAIRRAFEFYPAMNIEHKVERMNAFVSLVLGYSVVSILFQSNGGYSVNAYLGKAVLGLVQAFTFNWIYFDVDAHNIKLHAIRRAAVSSSLWTNAHLPFVMGYIVATSALTRLVLASDVPNINIEDLTSHYHELAEEHLTTGVRFFYCHGLAIALLSMGAISMSHMHRETTNLRIRKVYRLANRAAVCLVLFFLPLAHSLRSLDLVSITTGLSVWVLMFELWGKSSTCDPFIGEKRGCFVRYTAKCSKRELEQAHDGIESPPGRRSADILELNRNEKTAV